MKFISAAVCATAAFAAIALGGAPLSVADAEDDFLSDLAGSGVTFPANWEEQALAGGQQVCGFWSAGSDYNDVVSDITGPLVGNKSLAKKFVRAATNSLCPVYNSQLP